MNYSFSADTNPIWSPFLGWIRMDGLLLPLCKSGEPLKVPSIYTWQRKKFPPFDTFCPSFTGHGGRASLTMRVFLSYELWKGVWAVWTKEASLNSVFRQAPDSENLDNHIFAGRPVLYVLKYSKLKVRIIWGVSHFTCQKQKLCRYPSSNLKFCWNLKMEFGKDL